MDKNWETFSDWERIYKKKVLKTLSVDSAFEIFFDLWDAQTKCSSKGIEKIRKRKIEEIITHRKSFNLIQKRLHT